MRRNKLYTVNKWNHNLFADGGSVPDLSKVDISSYILGNPFGQLSQTPELPSSLSVLPKVNFLQGIGAFGKGLSGSNLGTGIAVGSNVIGGLGKGLLSNGLSTGVGEGISSIGSTVGSMVGAVNPLLGGAVSLGSNLIGGAVNGLFGSKVYGEKDALNYIDQMENISVNGSNDDIETAAASITDPSKVTYKDGWFTNKGKKKAAELNAKTLIAQDFANRSVNNAAINNAVDQRNNLLANFSALGGNITKKKYSGMTTNIFADGGGIHIKPSHRGRLTELKERTGKTEDELYRTGDLATRKMITFARNARKWHHALGGPLVGNGTIFADGGSTHGADFTNGVTEINTGGLHETNPNEGVQVGVDSEGKPNLVEEGEVIWNDFVFSNRISVPKEVRQRYKIHGKKDMSFADMAKKMQKESEERPNDPISLAGLNTSLEALARIQENIKEEQKAEQARKEFEALSPKEKAMVMQQMAQQQEAQQQAMQEQAMQEQQHQGEIPVEQETVPIEQAGNISAYGGPVNKYALGDTLKKYFPGISLSDLAGNIYDANKEALSKYNRDEWIKANSDVAKLEGKDMQDMLERTWWSRNPEAKNSQARMNFIPQTTWNPLNIGITSEPGTYWEEGAASPKGDWYRPIDEKYFAKDPAFLELTEDQRKLKGQELAKALEGTKAYKSFREYLKGDEKQALAWLGNLAEHGSKYASNRVKKDKDGNYTWSGNHSFKDFDKMLKDISYDADTNPNALSVGHLTTTPETPWRNRSFLRDENGNYTEITSPADNYKLINKDPYQTTIDGMNYRDSYYETADNSNIPESPYDKPYKPILKDERLRYAGLLGPVAGLGLWASGEGKPDTSELDAAVNASGVTPIMAKYKPIGDYLTYRPFDRDYYLNKMNSQAGATRRALLNSGTTPSRGAAILAADNTFLDKTGDLARQAEEYNLGQRERVAAFNRGTNQFNAEAYNRAALQYAGDYNNQRRFNAQMQAEAARQKMDARAGWYNSLYGNIGQLAAGIGAIGRENAQHNQIARMAADGVLGVITPEGNLGSTVVKYAHGGKMKKRRKGGLTY